MNELQGEFICPICNNNGIIWNNYSKYEKGDFKKWLCRKEYIKGKLENKWVFYESIIEKKWYCCACCGETLCGKVWRMVLTCKIFKEISKSNSEIFPNNCCLAALYSIFIMIFYLIYYIFYVLFFLWIDIINYCCGFKKKKIYYLVGQFHMEAGLSIVLHRVIENIDLIKKVIYNKIWDYAYSDEKWNSKRPWFCHKCKYESQTFKDFIPKTDLDKTIEKINLETDGLNLDAGIISALFTSVDGQINYSIPCKKTNIFSEVEKKLYIEYPNIKIKTAFLCNMELLLIKMIIWKIIKLFLDIL